MKRLLKNSILALLALTVALPAFGQLRAPNVYQTTLLTLRYTTGTIYKGTTANSILTGTLTLTANKSSCTAPAFSSCNIIYWAGSGTALAVTATPATAFTAGNVILGTATTDGTTLLVLTLYDGGGWGTAKTNYLSDGYLFIPPSVCGSKATTTTTTDNGMVPVATGNVVHQFTTNATGGTTQITCTFNVPGRTTAGKGALITDVSLLYGVQTTNISSIAAATVNTVLYAAAGAAAAGTVASAGGSLTVTPASLQLTTTTTGQCFNENLLFAVPVAAADGKSISVDQVFTNSAAATVYQVCGLVVHYFDAPI